MFQLGLGLENITTINDSENEDYDYYCFLLDAIGLKIVYSSFTFDFRELNLLYLQAS
jgi:hypothetical protein